MSLKLKNRWEYEGDDRWSWAAFIDDEGSGDLDDVEYVEYVLHHTFPKPLVRVDDPEGGFVLRTGGWGTFELRAFVHHRDEKKERLDHQIRLEYQPAEGVSA